MSDNPVKKFSGAPEGSLPVKKANVGGNWIKLDEGDSVEGIYDGTAVSQDADGKPRHIPMLLIDGVTWGLPDNQVLVGLLTSVTEGKRVVIHCLGRVKGQRRTYKDYDVYVID